MTSPRAAPLPPKTSFFMSPRKRSLQTERARKVPQAAPLAAPAAESGSAPDPAEPANGVESPSTAERQTIRLRRTSGESLGVGITDDLTIVEIAPDSPAALHSGLQLFDRIVAVGTGGSIPQEVSAAAEMGPILKRPGGPEDGELEELQIAVLRRTPALDPRSPPPPSPSTRAESAPASGAGAEEEDAGVDAADGADGPGGAPVAERADDPHGTSPREDSPARVPVPRLPFPFARKGSEPMAAPRPPREEEEEEGEGGWPHAHVEAYADEWGAEVVEERVELLVHRPPGSSLGLVLTDDATVVRVVPGSAAATDGRLRVGDRVLSLRRAVLRSGHEIEANMAAADSLSIHKVELVPVVIARRTPRHARGPLSHQPGESAATPLPPAELAEESGARDDAVGRVAAAPLLGEPQCTRYMDARTTGEWHQPSFASDPTPLPRCPVALPHAIHALVALPGAAAAGDADGLVLSAGRARAICAWSRDGAALCARAPGAHSDRICAMTALSDGSVASASADRTVRLWRASPAPPTGAATGAPWSLARLATLRGHAGAVRALASHGGLLASAADDGDVLLWGAAPDAVAGWERRGEPLRCAADASAPHALSSSHGVLWCAHWSGGVVGWDVERRLAPAHVYADAHAGPVHALARAHFAPAAVASAGGDGAVRLWDPRQPLAAIELGVGTSPLYTLATERAEPYVVAAAGYDCVVRLWDVRAIRIASTLRAHKAPVRALLMLPGATRSDVWSADADGCVCVHSLSE